MTVGVPTVSKEAIKPKDILSLNEIVSPTEQKEPTAPKEPKAPKNKIPKNIKTFVWNTYIGKDKTEAKCPCCQQETIDCRRFDCGHVVAEANGGTCLVDNLRPICAPCNSAMGTTNMNDFAMKWFGRSV